MAKLLNLVPERRSKMIVQLSHSRKSGPTAAIEVRAQLDDPVAPMRGSKKELKQSGVLVVKLYGAKDLPGCSARGPSCPKPVIEA